MNCFCMVNFVEQYFRRYISRYVHADFELSELRGAGVVDIYSLKSKKLLNLSKLLILRF